MKVNVNVELNRPKWLNRMLLVTLLLVAASGVGCYFWGVQSVDEDAVIRSYLAGRSQEVVQGMRAGAAVTLVGNKTISDSWIAFCNSIVTECANLTVGR